MEITQEHDAAGITRSAGAHHVVPFKPCPICGHGVDILHYDDLYVYTVECPSCGLAFGSPNGYASRLDMVSDWNRRSTPKGPKIDMAWEWNWPCSCWHWTTIPWFDIGLTSKIKGDHGPGVWLNVTILGIKLIDCGYYNKNHALPDD